MSYGVFRRRPPRPRRPAWVPTAVAAAAATSLPLPRRLVQAERRERPAIRPQPAVVAVAKQGSAVGLMRIWRQEPTREVRPAQRGMLIGGTRARSLKPLPPPALAVIGTPVFARAVWEHPRPELLMTAQPAAPAATSAPAPQRYLRLVKPAARAAAERHTPATAAQQAPAATSPVRPPARRPQLQPRRRPLLRLAPPPSGPVRSLPRLPGRRASRRRAAAKPPVHRLLLPSRRTTSPAWPKPGRLLSRLARARLRYPRIRRRFIGSPPAPPPAFLFGPLQLTLRGARAMWRITAARAQWTAERGRAMWRGDR